MAYRTDGSSALKYDDLFGSNNSNVSKSEAKVVNLDDYRNAVEKKIAEISQTATENLNGDKNLANELRSEVRSIIREEEIKTSREEIDDLAEIISRRLERENNSEVKIEAKKIRLEINKWKEENIKEVNEFRKEEFKNEFEEETKKLNPNLKSEELIKVKECGKLISDVYFDESVIENQKDESLEFNKQQYSPGQLENAWTDLKGVTNFLKRTPGQIKDIKEKYSSIKDGLKNINLPNNLKEVRSFDKVISIFSNEGANGLFNKTILKIGQNFVDKIGNQAIGEFAKNSLNVLAKEGFQKGFGTILNGILSGGVKTAATTAVGSAAVTGAAIGAATGPPGWLITAALAAGKFIKDKLGKIAESLGISGKKFLEENFGKVGGKIISGIVSLVALPGVLIGTISATVIGPILIAVFVFLFGYQMFQGSLVSSLVPPKGTDTSDYNEISGDGLEKTSIVVIDINGIERTINYNYNSDGIDLSDMEKALPPTNTFKRSDIVKTAEAVLGLGYYWGGGHASDEPKKGIDTDWGKEVESDSKGRKYYGVDCSGFVGWVFYQVTGKNITTVATSYYIDSTKKISTDELLPGDIAVQCPYDCDINDNGDTNHVGIYVGTGTDGQKYCIHSGGTSTQGGPQGLGGVVITKCDDYFHAYARITQGGINLIGDL